jgi:type VI secretion system protein ImpG
MRDELLGYYERELIFLRQMGAEFAQKYPKIATRLLLEAETCEDPHVERLLEAFAFLAGRIHLKLDDEFPEITEAFLNVLYPHYLAPVPSMAIVQFSHGSEQDKLTTGQLVEKGTKLFSRPVQGSPCRFQTAYPITLWPISIDSAALESLDPVDTRGKWSEAVIRISAHCYGNVNLHELKLGDTDKSIESLRFYLHGEPQIVYPLYEMIFNNATRVEIKAKEPPLSSSVLTTLTKISLSSPAPVVMPPSTIKSVGFEIEEGMLPYSARSFPGYRLLTEYFTFPQKFLFFDVTGFNEAVRKKFGSYFDILIYLKDVTPPRAPTGANNFRLGCAPVINLFSQLAEPIYLSQKRYEYHVLADVERQTTTEIYSLDQVSTTDPRLNETREYFPFYSFRHAYEREQDKSFWYMMRRPSQRVDDFGTEVYISLVDLNFNPRVPPVEVLNVRATCSNRDLPAKLPFGGREGDFEIEGTAIFSRVHCLTKPTDTVRPPQRRAGQWRLISHLGLNHLSLVENPRSQTPEALQEILMLYDFTGSSAARKQILGMTGVEARRVTRQIGQRVGAGFVRGIETTLEFDEDQYVGSGLYLFAAVLERFLGLYASLNSFNQLVVKTKQREGEFKRWPPRAGEKILL